MYILETDIIGTNSAALLCDSPLHCNASVFLCSAARLCCCWGRPGDAAAAALMLRCAALLHVCVLAPLTAGVRVVAGTPSFKSEYPSPPILTHHPFPRCIAFFPSSHHSPPDTLACPHASCRPTMRPAPPPPPPPPSLLPPPPPPPPQLPSSDSKLLSPVPLPLQPLL